MTDKQKRSVDFGGQIAGKFSVGLPDEQLAKLILDELAKAQGGEYPSLEDTATTRLMTCRMRADPGANSAALNRKMKLLGHTTATDGGLCIRMKSHTASLEIGCIGSLSPLEVLLATL